MRAPLLLATGFGPFLRVARNPSGELALALAADPPEGVDVAARVLSVSFRDAPRELEEALAALAPRLPDAILALGVQREAWFRLERRARALLDSKKPDREGRFARELGPIGARDLATPLALEPLLAALIDAGAARAGISDEAGGYVCERTYYAALTLGERHRIPALFLHVPPFERVPTERQLPPVRALAARLATLVAPAPD